MKRYPAPGTRIYCKGMGKRAPGTVTASPPISTLTYKDRGLVTYRADYNGGEYLAPLEKCRLLKTKVYKNETNFSEEDDE